MRKTQGRNKVVFFFVAFAMLAAVAAAAVANPVAFRVPSRKASAPSPWMHVMVQLTEQPTSVIYAQHKAMQGIQAKASAKAAAAAQLATVHAEQARFDGTLAAAKLPNVREIYRVQRSYNGFVLMIESSQLPKLRALPGVKGVYPMTPKHLVNAHSIPFIGAQKSWTGLLPPPGLHGEEMKVGIIDTGIDYFHRNFDGTADYSPNVDPNVVETDTFPMGKVVGGWDFAGHDYVLLPHNCHRYRGLKPRTS